MTPPPAQTTILRYRYRLRPGRVAERALLAEWDRCRWVWNQCVARAEEQRAEGDKVNTWVEMARELTDWRSRFEWLEAGSRCPQGQMIIRWRKARKAAFTVRGRGHPKYKSKRTALPSLEYVDKDFAIVDGRLKLSKVPPIPVVWSRALPSEPTSVVVTRDAIGHWYASFIVRVEEQPKPATGKAIGIDWGLAKVATTTDERFDLKASRFTKAQASNIAKAQRQMSRRRRPKGQPPSKGYLAAKRKAAKRHAKAKRQRADIARKWARRVALHHDLIAAEDLDTTFMRKNRRLAKATADAGIGMARRNLAEYASRFGRKLVEVPPQHTTNTCAQCGTVRTKRLELAQRTFECEACGHTADRDRNAARVILARAANNPAGVDGVRLEPLRGSKQPELGNRKDQISVVGWFEPTDRRATIGNGSDRPDSPEERRF